MGNTITVLPSPDDAPAGGTMTVRHAGDRLMLRATPAAASGPGGRPGGQVYEEVPLTGSTRSEGAR